MTDEPAGLGERGSKIFRDLAFGEPNPILVQMIIEAARAADRLDDLDRAVQGQGVLDLMRMEIEQTTGMNPDAKDVNFNVKLSFAGVLSEARQQQDNFRRLMTDISRLQKARVEIPIAPPKPDEAPQDAVADELAQRRALREQNMTG